MGQDKALLPFPVGSEESPRTFLEQLIHVLDYCCSEVLIIARDREQASRYAHSDARIVLDTIPGSGPLVGLASGLQATSSLSAVLVAVDMPFVTPRLLAFLISRYQEGTLLVPFVNGNPQVTLAIYPRSVLHLIEERIRQGRRDLRSLLNDMPIQYVDEEELRAVDPALRSFVRINIPEELRNACP